MLRSVALAIDKNKKEHANKTVDTIVLLFMDYIEV